MKRSVVPLAEVALTPGTRGVVEALGVRSSSALVAMTRDQVLAVSPLNFAAWREVCRVLERLSYDVFGRSMW